MGGNQGEDCDDWQLTGPSSGVTTMVLVGRTGNGKSETGNSILGRNAFDSRSSSSGVTATCDLQHGVMNDGRVVSVVDTPGLFDSAVSTDFPGKEIVKCINLAKNGVHGVLLVLSVRNRFTSEEAAALESLQMLFGDKIVNYMVIVFTGGDELEYHKQTLKGYLDKCPPELQVEEKLQITTEKLEQQLASERSAREQADEEIRRLKEKLEQANEETDNLKKQINKCVIL